MNEHRSGRSRTGASPSGKVSDLSHESSAALDRFLDHVAESAEEATRCLGLQPPPDLAMMLQLMRRHLRGRMETPSSLIAASGLPRGTAYRAIMKMLERGQILRRPRSASGKTYSLHPSESMVSGWFDYARRCRALSSGTFGGATPPDYFFGGSYLAATTIHPLPALDTRLRIKDSLRILLHADPAFLAMRKVKRQLELHFGTRIEVRALSIDRLHQEILANSSRSQSQFDIVTCDVCWMAELIDRDILRPLGPAATEGGLADFHPPALSTAERHGRLWGLPVQTTPELLIYRSDLLAARGLSPPRTLDALLETARALHAPADGIAGICWNGARGTPVGTTFMLLMADFGRPVLDLPRDGAGFADRDLSAGDCRPMLDSPEALEAAEFLIELLQVSPDTVLQMSWFERAQCYAEGRAAMAYCYTQIMPMFDADPSVPAHGRTGYALHPSAPGVRQLAPLGGWNLSVPANLAPARAEEVERAVRSLASPEAIKSYIEGGSVVTSRFSVCNDPGVAHRGSVIPVVDRYVRDGRVHAWPRPAVPDLSRLVTILGEEIHAMLLRNKRPRDALRESQARAERMLMRNVRD